MVNNYFCLEMKEKISIEDIKMLYKHHGIPEDKILILSKEDINKVYQLLICNQEYERKKNNKRKM